MNPYVSYADTEAICTKHSGCCSFGSLLVDRTSGKSANESSRGSNCIENFFDYIRTKATVTFSAKQNFRKLDFSNGKRKQLLLDPKNCVICHKMLAEDEVVHHDQTTGYIVGVAHNSCDLKVRTQSFTPILFHNLSRYDSHH